MMNSNSTKTRKRNFQEVTFSPNSAFGFEELNQDLLERVLSRLPPSSFFRLRSVCKKWSSVDTSITFLRACSQVTSREPWFLMVGPDTDTSTVYDTSERTWKNLDPPNFPKNSIPVASSGGLVCFRAPSGKLFINNPLTGTRRDIPTPCHEPLLAIAMNSSCRVMLVYGELPNLKSQVFDSRKNQWEEETSLRKSGDTDNDTDTVYFLSKAGEVVTTNMQRSPSKQYSSVLTKEGNINFLSHSGTILSCNLAKGTYEEYPRILPAFFEYSIDIVECNGEMLVVVLSEVFETASLRVWRFEKRDRSWRQVAVMPPWMSHGFYGKKADINCVGHGEMMMVCLSSPELSWCFMCDLGENEWVELPKCCKEFVSAAFAFEPRIEASV